MANMSTIPVVHAPTALARAVDHLRERLERAAARSGPFRDGETIEVAGVPFKAALDSRGLRLSAPRIGSVPMTYTEDCSDALHIVAGQLALLEGNGVRGKPISWFQTAVVVKDLFSCHLWTLERARTAKKSWSGWTIGAYDSAHDRSTSGDVQHVRLWELICRKPEIAPYLELPKGWQVSFEDAYPVVMKNGVPTEPIDFALWSSMHA